MVFGNNVALGSIFPHLWGEIPSGFGVFLFLCVSIYLSLISFYQWRANTFDLQDKQETTSFTHGYTFSS